MNSATTQTKAPRKTIDDLVYELNAKARDAGCDVRVGKVQNRTGNCDGLAFLGGNAADQDRAVRFAAAYFDRHVAPYKRDPHWSDLGTVDVYASGWVLRGRRRVRIVNLGECEFGSW